MLTFPSSWNPTKFCFVYKQWNSETASVVIWIVIVFNLLEFLSRDILCIDVFCLNMLFCVLSEHAVLCFVSTCCFVFLSQHAFIVNMWVVIVFNLQEFLSQDIVCFASTWCFVFFITCLLSTCCFSIDGVCFFQNIFL